MAIKKKDSVVLNPMTRPRKKRKLPEIKEGTPRNQIKRDSRTTALPMSIQPKTYNTDEVKDLIKANNKMNLDGWANTLVGLSGRMDKRSGTAYGFFHLVPDEELECIYFGDGLGRRLVDVVADDMTREWVKIEPVIADEENTQDPDGVVKDAQIIEAELERLDASSKFNEALKWSRLYGGSIIVIGALDGQDLSQPLRINNIKDIDYLRVVDRSDIYLASSIFQMDANLPGFGQPIVLRVIFYVGTRTIYQDVHVSRCILFKGNAVPAGATLELNAWERFWGLSDLQLNYEALRDWGGIMESVANLMYESVIGKYKLANLQAMLAEGNEDAIVKRMEIIQACKSVIHGVMLGEGEDYIRDSITFGGIPDVLDRFMNRLSSTSGIPVTKLFGRSAAGMNATGEGDQSDYYDGIKSNQITKLKPGVRRLVSIIKTWKKINTEFQIELNPLFQLSEQEEADVELKNAQAGAAKAQMYSTYIMAGVLDQSEVHGMEFPDAEFDDSVSLPPVDQNVPGDVPKDIKGAGNQEPADTDIPTQEVPPTTEGRVGI